MRLHLRVINKNYYDIGLRKGNEILSKTTERFGETQPRYLEDFIEAYGKGKIVVIDYGSLFYEKEYIDGIL